MYILREQREAKTLYPNLADYYNRSPMCKATFCSHAEISKEQFDRVLFNNAELSLGEAYGLAKLTGLDIHAIRCSKIIILDPARYRHTAMIKQLEKDLRYIWQYAAAGDERAIEEVNGDGRTVDVRLAEYIDLFLSGKATLAGYLVRWADLHQAKNNIRAGRMTKKDP